MIPGRGKRQAAYSQSPSRERTRRQLLHSNISPEMIRESPSVSGALRKCTGPQVTENNGSEIDLTFPA